VQLTADRRHSLAPEVRAFPAVALDSLLMVSARPAPVRGGVPAERLPLGKVQAA
jgi:hypothetical protein